MFRSVPGTGLHLLGSFHALIRPPEFRDVELQAFDAAELVVREASHEGFSLPASMTSLPPKETLQTLLGEAVYAQAVDFVVSRDLDRSILEEQPWLVALKLGNAVRESIGMIAENGIEVRLGERGRRLKKLHYFLETPLDALRAFADAPLSEARRAVSAAASNSEEQLSLARALDEAGARREIALTRPSYDLFARRSPWAFKALLEQRNHAWLPDLLRFARGGQRVFMMVGALHMLGPDGVLELLRREGLETEAL